jgi:phage-related protein
MVTNMSPEDECGIRGKFRGSGLRGGTSRSSPTTFRATCSTLLRSPPKAASRTRPNHFKGVDGGVFEIALKYRGDAFRAIYAVKIAADIWVIHAFQKKSRTGIKTPQMEVDLIIDRLKRLKEALK